MSFILELTTKRMCSCAGVRHVAGQAVGMSGKATFGFELVFYEPVQSEVSRCMESSDQSALGLASYPGPWGEQGGGEMREGQD